MCPSPRLNPAWIRQNSFSFFVYIFGSYADTAGSGCSHYIRSVYTSGYDPSAPGTVPSTICNVTIFVTSGAAYRNFGIPLYEQLCHVQSQVEPLIEPYFCPFFLRFVIVLMMKKCCQNSPHFIIENHGQCLQLTPDAALSSSPGGCSNVRSMRTCFPSEILASPQAQYTRGPPPLVTRWRHPRLS